MKTFLFTVVTALTVGLFAHADSTQLLTCSSGGSKDGAGIMTPPSLKATGDDQSVKITIVAFRESLQSRLMIERHEDFTHSVSFTSLSRADFVKKIQNSGNAVYNEGKDTLEISFDKSDCQISDSDARVFVCSMKGYKGTAVQTNLVTTQYVPAAYTKLNVNLSVFPDVSLQTPIAYFEASCK